MIKPMLAKIGTEDDLAREGYVYEPKLDGFRALCHKKGDEITLYNRKLEPITYRFPEFQFAESLNCDECILDGEIVAYNEQGNPDFRLLMKRSMKLVHHTNRVNVPAVYTAFDICMKDGENLTLLTLMQRRKILEETIVEGPRIQVMINTANGRKLWSLMTQRNLEGVVAKEMHSSYLPGKRSDCWIKIKAFKTQDCIIVGYKSDIRLLSSLAMAVYCEEGGSLLKYIGNVGTGFTEALCDEIFNMVSPLQTHEPPPFPVPAGTGEIKWINPELICEVKYLEFDSKGLMRNPVFLRLRKDKPLEECILESSQIHCR